MSSPERHLRFDPITDARNVPPYVHHGACFRCYRPFAAEDAAIVHRKTPGVSRMRPVDLEPGMVVCMRCVLSPVDHASLIVPFPLHLLPGAELPWPRIVSGVLASGYLVIGVTHAGVHIIALNQGHPARFTLTKAQRAITKLGHEAPRRDPIVELRPVSLSKADAPDLESYRQPVPMNA